MINKLQTLSPRKRPLGNHRQTALNVQMQNMRVKVWENLFLKVTRDLTLALTLTVTQTLTLTITLANNNVFALVLFADGLLVFLYHHWKAINYKTKNFQQHAKQLPDSIIMYNRISPNNNCWVQSGIH